MKFALEEFKERGVRGVILHLNTPGGEVFSSMKIAELLQKFDALDKIPVIAFIDNWAISAGAMLAYSCRFIGCVQSSVMGAAEPVFQGKEGMESAPEKVNSALRAEFSNLAAFFGRNPLIAQAMVDKDIVLVVRNSEVVRLESNDDIRAGEKVITRGGKLLTLDSKELMEFGVADFIVDADLFEQPYLAAIPNVKKVTYANWRVAFFSFLAHPVVSALLLLGLIIGFYIEINTPGFGIPGSIAAVCLGLILLSNFAIYAVSSLELIFLGVGLVLLLIELFVIPGFGITGIVGILLMIIGLFALMIPALDTATVFNSDALRLVLGSILERLAWLCGALIVSAVVIALLARFVSHKFYTWAKIVHKGEQEGYSVKRGEMPAVGEKGEAATPLRPSGKVSIGGVLYDGMTTGAFIEKGISVIVIRIQGNTVVVKQC